MPWRYIKLLTVSSIILITFGLLPNSSLAVTLRFWNVGDAYDGRMYRVIAGNFERETGIHVIVQPISWGQFYTKYLTAMAAGDPPDLATTNLGGPGDYGSIGGLVDLQAMFPKEIEDLKQKSFEGPWRIFYFQNHLYGIPQGMTSLGIYYRKDIFAKLGIKPPNTWSELKEVIRVLEANEYQYSVSFTRDSGWAIGQFVWPLGTETMSTDGTKVNWQDPRFREGFKFAIGLWNNGNIELDKGLELFVSDEKGFAAPMMIDGIWYYLEIEKRAPFLKGKWGIVPMPAADNGQSASILGGTSFVIFRKSKHPKEAMQWIQYYYRKDVQKYIFNDNMNNRGEGRNLFLSPLKEFWDEPLPGIPKDDQESLKQIMYCTRSWPYIVGSPESDRFLDNSFSRLRNDIRDYLISVAGKEKTTLFKINAAFAQGKYPDEYKKFLNYESNLCDEEIDRITPLANKALAERLKDFNKYYTNIVERLPALEKKKDVLFYSKIASGILILCCLGFILLNSQARKNWYSYLYITPTVLSLLIFLFIPMCVSIYIAFTAYNPVLPLSTADWVGLKNFKGILFANSQIFTDSANANLSWAGKLKMFLSENDLWSSFGRTLVFCLIVIPLQMFMAVLFAIGLDKKLKPDRMFKFVYFSPLVTSVVSVALIWTVLFLGAKYGWINALLLNLRLIRDPVNFLHNSQTFLYAVIAMSVWQGLAFTVLIYLAGLQNIPNELYEAAAIDGANALQNFWQITLSMLRPQILFLTVTGTIGALQVFDQIYVLGGGAGEAGSKFGPADSGMTMVCYLYRKGFEDFKMGESSAIAYILFAIIFVLTYINFKWLFGKKVD